MADEVSIHNPSASFTLTSDDWESLTPEARAAWRVFIEAHGLDARTVGFPFTLSGGTMRFFEYALRPNGEKWIVGVGEDRHPAGAERVVVVDPKIPMPAVS